MNVRLIAITKPVIDEAKSAGDLVAYCARVSNPANQVNTETAPRLLRYLVNHQHWSPFEMAHAVLEINTTRDIARQILRHRSFSFQEFSGRYAEMPDEPVYREVRMQDTENRQNSLECEHDGVRKQWKYMQKAVSYDAFRYYQAALGMGVAKEVARALLPEGMVRSRLYMSGSLRSWIHYLAVRTTPDTQKEHRKIAIQCAEVLAQAVPELDGLLAPVDSTNG